MYRHKGFFNPFHKTGDFGHGKESWNEQPEFTAYEDGYDDCLKSILKLLKEKAPYSKLVDILSQNET